MVYWKGSFSVQKGEFLFIPALYIRNGVFDWNNRNRFKHVGFIRKDERGIGRWVRRNVLPFKY